MTLKSVVNVSDHFNIIDQFQYILNASQYLTVLQLVSHVYLIISLNKKQEIVTFKIFQYYLDKVYFKARTEFINQLLLYVRGEGEVRKSQMIKIITIELQMLNHQQNFHIMALTGAAADNIDGSIIHITLNMSVLNRKDYQKQRKKNQQSELSSFYTKNL